MLDQLKKNAIFPFIPIYIENIYFWMETLFWHIIYGKNHIGNVKLPILWQNVVMCFHFDFWIMMNLMYQLCNGCKYTGAKYWLKPSHTAFIERFDIHSKSQQWVFVWFWLILFQPFDRRWVSARNQSAVDATNKKADHVDEKFELIYKPPSSQMLMVATSFCSISSFSCPFMLANYAYDRFFEKNMELIEQVPTVQVVGMGVMGILSMVALSFCRTVPIRIYRHEKEYVSCVFLVFFCLWLQLDFRYIAIFPSAIPGLKRKLEFKKGDVKERKTTGWLKKLLGNFLKPGFESSNTYRVKNRKIFLSVPYFNTPAHLYEMFPNTAKYVRKVKQLTKESI